MRLRLIYHNDVLRTDREGRWDDLPDNDLQIVDIITGRREFIRALSGFDFYFRKGFIIGGWFDDPRPWDRAGHSYRLTPTEPPEYLGTLPRFPRGTVPPEARGGSIKVGRLIRDSEAAKLGFVTTRWREYLQQWKEDHGEA